MASVSNTLELIKGIEEAGVAIVEILKDGLTFADLLKAGGVLMGGWAVIKNAGGVLPELKDLDATEINQVTTAAYSAIKAILLASKK